MGRDTRRWPSFDNILLLLFPTKSNLTNLACVGDIPPELTSRLDWADLFFPRAGSPTQVELSALFTQICCKVSINDPF
jgi:hypothetical protein